MPRSNHCKSRSTSSRPVFRRHRIYEKPTWIPLYTWCPVAATLPVASRQSPVCHSVRSARKSLWSRLAVDLMARCPSPRSEVTKTARKKNESTSSRVAVTIERGRSSCVVRSRQNQCIDRSRITLCCSHLCHLLKRRDVLRVSVAGSGHWAGPDHWSLVTVVSVVSVMCRWPSRQPSMSIGPSVLRNDRAYDRPVIIRRL